MSLFKQQNPDTGVIEPVQLRLGQLKIAMAIIFRYYKRVIIICPTQYGKSFVVGLAVLIGASILRLKFLIVAPKDDQARIIMNVIINHLFDHPLFFAYLNMEDKDKVSKFQKLQEQHSKSSLRWSHGGSVRVISAQESRQNNFGAVMGQGEENVILDESSLISNTKYATVKRMIGAYKERGFMLEIGNPFEREPHHFHRTWKYRKNYHKIMINLEQALAEGAFTQAFIDEMREDIGEDLFKVFYQCMFPNEDTIDEKGYRWLVSHGDLKFMTGFPTEEQLKEELHLGCDIGGGGDKSTGYLRGKTWAKLAWSMKTIDIMMNVTKIEEFVTKDMKGRIKWGNVHIDDVGIGRGCTDRLKEKGYQVDAVSAGSPPSTKNASKRFFNRKAEMSWLCREWLKAGHPIDQEGSDQLSWLKYKINSDKQVRMEPKADMKKRSGRSPDEADALILTFNPHPIVEVTVHRPRGM